MVKAFKLQHHQVEVEVIKNGVMIVAGNTIKIVVRNLTVNATMIIAALIVEAGIMVILIAGKGQRGLQA